MGSCTNCGARLDPDARFCSRCGRAVAPADNSEAPTVVAPGRVPARQNRTWWIGPAAIVALVVIAWLVIAGLPFGRREGIEVTSTEDAATETVAEGAPPPGSPNLAPIPLSNATDLGYETTQAAPPIILPETSALPPDVVVPPPMVSAQPPPDVTRPPVIPPPVAEPAPQAEPPDGESPAQEPMGISEAEAGAILRRFVTETDYYRVADPCVQVRATGARNDGYGFGVWDACAGAGASRRLGVWRVDARTGEVFVRNDGKYRRP